MQNTDYKCPYCGRDSYSESRGSKKQGKFENWKSVTAHLPSCDKNNKSYIICQFYGPIEVYLINKYSSIDEFKRDFPSISIHPSRWRTLRNSGIINLRKIVWSKEDCLVAIKDYYNKYKRTPTYNEFNISNFPEYPSGGTICNNFGTWNQAIDEAGLELNEKQFGTPTTAKDNILYRSRTEAYFVDNYLYEKYTYEYEPKYINKPWFYDFYIKELNLFIEITDYIDPVRIVDKIKYNKENNINFRLIERSKLYKKDFRL